MKKGGPFAGLALWALVIALSWGCGPKGEAPTVAPPPGAAPSGTTRRRSIPGASRRTPRGGTSAPAAGAELAWDVPGGWVTETPSSEMRKAQYAIPAAAGDAEGGQCAVFYFGPGQGGDIQSNVDRWATQFTGAGGHPTPAITETMVAGRKVLKVTMEGTYNASTMTGGDAVPKPGTLLLGAIVEGPDSNWFFKCTGPSKTMQAHRKEFDALVESVRFRRPGSPSYS